MPIMEAESNPANVAPSSALKPYLASKCLWLGAIPPIPPICIPTEAKLANPHNT
jgi:hypothetical protein